MLSSAGTSIKLWDTQNFKLVQEINGNTHNDISDLSWNKDGQALTSLDKQSSEIALYTVNSSSAVCSLVMRLMDNITCLQFCNTTNRYLAVGGAKDSLLIWDVKGNFKKKSFTVARAGITKLSFSSSDSHLAVGTLQGDIFLISNTNHLISGPVKLFSEKTKVKDIRYSSLNRSLIGACGENGSVALLDVNTTKVFKEFSQSHSAPISSLAFSPINELLMITVGYDKKFVSYNTNTKNIVFTHQTTFPLTSACFMSNGQCVALGTMTGKVLIYDLRVLTNPLVTIDAHKGAAHDLKIQPQPKVQNSKTPKTRTKNFSNLDRINVPNIAQKDKRTITKSDNLNHPETNLVNEKNSPSKFDLLSPMNPQINQEEAFALKTPLLKNFKTPAKSFRREIISADDLGILSPINKENQSPSYTLSTPKVHGIAKQTFVEGLLSPLQTSPSSNTSCSQSPLNRSITKSETSLSFQQEPKEHLIEDYTELLLSPLKKESSKLRDEIPICEGKASELLNITSVPCIGDTSCKISEIEEMKPLPTAASGDEIMLNSHCVEKEVKKVHKEISDQNVEPKKCDLGESTETDSISTANVIPVIVDDQFKKCSESERSEATTKSVTFADRKKSSENNIYEIAFPPSEISNEANIEDDVRSLLGRDHFENLNSSNINLDLVQNCVSDALERHQFEVNKRFMHMHYTMLKHFFHMKKEMNKLIKENSINEEILLENQQLKEEIKRLRCTY